MQILPTPDFLARISPDGLRLDDRYPEPRTLNYQNNLGICAPMPTDTLQRAQAFFAALDLFDDHPIYVYRRRGIWNFTHRPDRNVRNTLDRAVAALFQRLPLPNDTEGTLLFAPAERDLLFALLYMNSIAAGSVADDLFLIPAHHRFVLWLDHDEQLILDFRDAPAQTEFLSRFQQTWSKLRLPPLDD